VNPETPTPDEPSTTAYVAPAPTEPEGAASDGVEPAAGAPAAGETAGGEPIGGEPDRVDPDGTDETGSEPARGPHWEPVAEPPDPVDRPRYRVLVGLALAIVVALLGVPLAYVWSSVAPWLPAQVSGDELLYADPTGEQRAGAESWFVLLMLGTGIVVALATWYGLRRFRGSVTVAALAIGATAAGWLTWRIGHNIGAGAVIAKERHAHDGQIIMLPPALRVKSPGNVATWHGIPYVGGVLLYMALAAVATYVIAVLVTYNPALNRRRPAALPEAPPEA
jgi:hypothetical protein